MKKIFTFCTFLTLIIFSVASRAAEEAEIPAGNYALDKTHASLIFRVNHLGLSNYALRFKSFDADLKFDPKKPEKSHVLAVIDPTSLETDYPNPQEHDFNASLQGDKWIDAKKFPKITFRSKKVELTGDNKARITGDLILHGVKHAVTLDAIFNGGHVSTGVLDRMGTRIGFSARGSLKRSDFGVSYGIPEKGSKMGVGDDVAIEIEAEFLLKK